MPIVLIDIVGILAIFAIAVSIAIFLIYGIYYVTRAYPFTSVNEYFDTAKRSVSEVLSQPLIDTFGYNPWGVKSYELQNKILIYSAFITMCMTSLWLWIALILSPVIRALVWSRFTGLTLVGFILRRS